MAARKKDPDLMREFVLVWVRKQPKANGDRWSLAELGRHLGTDKGTMSRMFGGETDYSRRDYLPQIGEFIGKTPLQIYEGALRLWKRDPTGATLQANRD